MVRKEKCSLSAFQGIFKIYLFPAQSNAALKKKSVSDVNCVALSSLLNSTYFNEKTEKTKMFFHLNCHLYAGI